MIKKRFLSLLVLLMVAVTGAVAATTTVTWNSSNVSDLRAWAGSPYSKEGITLSVNPSALNWNMAEWYDGIAFVMRDSGGFTFTAPSGKNFTKIEMTFLSDYSTVWSRNASVIGSGWSVGEKVTWTGDAESVGLATGAEDFQGIVTSIVFTIADAVAVTGVSLSPSTASLTVGQKVALTATVLPAELMDKTVTWTVGGTNADAVKLYTDEDCETEVGSAATAALTVYAKGLSAGAATVTVASNADPTKTATCAMTVTPPTYSVVLTAESDDEDNWTAKAGDGDYQSLPLEDLEAGTQVGLKYDGPHMVKSVSVARKYDPVSSITLNKTATVIIVGQKETLSVTRVKPETAREGVTWSSSNTGVTTVNAETGEVTGVAAGTATITATAADGSGVTATCAVTVRNPTLADVFTEGAEVSVKANCLLDGYWYQATGTYSSGSYADVNTTSSGFLYHSASMTKNGDNLVVWIESSYNRITITFYTTENKYKIEYTENNEYYDMRTLNSITINGVDITSTLTEYIAPVLTSITVSYETGSGTIQYYEGNTWAQAINNSELSHDGWSVEDSSIKFTVVLDYEDGIVDTYILKVNGSEVNCDDVIDSSKNYSLEEFY